MVQRVTVSPSEVRGYGDIVSPKNLDDFTEYMCELSESDGIYTMVYDDTATYLTLSASPTTITYGESVVFTATLTIEGQKASGETVYFYEGETLLGSDETDNNGVATLTKSDFTISTHSVKAVYDEIESSTVTVTVNKVTPTITFASDKSVLLSGGTFTLSGTLSLTSGTVKLYDGNTFIEDLTVTGGAFSKTITGTLGTHNYKVISVETSEYESVTSSTVSVSVVDSSNYIELGVSGSSFRVRSNAFSYTGGVAVDWGDSSGLVEYTGNRIDHNYASSGNHTVKVYGDITALKGDCFTSMTNLNTVVLPDSVTGIYPNSFEDCTALTEIVLNWDSASEIIEYTSFWISGCTSFDHFLIPQGTKSLYTAKNYPSALLKEDGEPTPATITLTGTKNILSYADSESSVLTATVLDDNDDPVEGVSVELYKDSVLWDTLTTGSAGTVSKTYTSAGVGDVGFTAECGSLVTETYDIQDLDYYAEWSKITSTWSTDTSISGRTIYNYLTNFGNDVSIEFKYKNSVPSNTLIGFGKYYSGSNEIKGIFFNHNNSSQAWWSQGTSLGSSESLGATPTSNDVLKITVENNTTVKWYLNDTLLKTKTARTDFGQTLRIDDFTSTPMELEYIKVKKL